MTETKKNCRDCYYHDPYDGELTELFRTFKTQTHVICGYGFKKYGTKKEDYGKVIENKPCEHFRTYDII